MTGLAVPDGVRGKLYDEHTMFLKIGGGEVSDPNTGEVLYTFATCIPTSTPILVSRKTHRTYTLPWKDIIEMAREAGIDEEADGT